MERVLYYPTGEPKVYRRTTWHSCYGQKLGRRVVADRLARKNTLSPLEAPKSPAKDPRGSQEPARSRATMKKAVQDTRNDLPKKPPNVLGGRIH